MDQKENTTVELTERILQNAMQSYINALNNKDIPGIVSLFAEEGTIEDPVGSITEKASV